MSERLQPDARPCAHCGTPVADDRTYCPSCGQPYIPDAGDAPGPPRGTPYPPGPAGGAPYPSAPAAPTPDARTWALAAHLGALAGAVLGGLPAFLGPLVVWLLRREAGDAFATAHARSALNFNISVIVYAIVAVVISVLTLGLALLAVVPLGLVAFAGYFVATILGAVAASKGRPFRYPLTIRFVR